MSEKMNEKNIVENKSRHIANQANRAFDQRQALAEDLANFDGATDLSRTGYEALQTAHTLEASLFRQLVNAAAARFDSTGYDDSRVDSDLSETAAVGVETETDKSTFEQKIETTRKELHERYDVSLEELWTVETKAEDGETTTTIIQASPNGIDPVGNPAKEYDPRRSYNSLESDSRYLAEDGSRTILSSETLPAYHAMIEQARRQNLPLPDSEEAKDEHGAWTGAWVMDTADAGNARFVDVRGGRVDSRRELRDYDSRYLRVRLAVVIA